MHYIKEMLARGEWKQLDSSVSFVVTGASGFIGSHLVDAGSSMGANVLSVVRSEVKAAQLGFGRWILFNEQFAQELLQSSFGSSVIVHLAASSRAGAGVKPTTKRTIRGKLLMFIATP